MKDARSILIHPELETVEIGLELKSNEFAESNIIDQLQLF